MDIAEDMSNKEEFIFESTPSMVTVSTPEIPQQCGNVTGVDWSKLTRTQKKKFKTKSKIKNVNQILKDSDQIWKSEMPLLPNNNIDINEKTMQNAPDSNPFAVLLLPECKLTTQDTLISATQDLIKEQLGFVKLDENEIIPIIEMINHN